MTTSVTDDQVRDACAAYWHERTVATSNTATDFAAMRKAIEAALRSQGKVVSVTALENLASYWENGGHRTGVDYVNALQECADHLMTFVDGQSCKQPDDLTAIIGEGD